MKGKDFLDMPIKHILKDKELLKGLIDIIKQYIPAQIQVTSTQDNSITSVVDSTAALATLANGKWGAFQLTGNANQIIIAAKSSDGSKSGGITLIA